MQYAPIGATEPPLESRYSLQSCFVDETICARCECAQHTLPVISDKSDKSEAELLLLAALNTLTDPRVRIQDIKLATINDVVAVEMIDVEVVKFNVKLIERLTRKKLLQQRFQCFTRSGFWMV